METFDWAYSEKVKEHFMYPKNLLKKDEDFKEDGRGLVGNIQCGDQMLLLIKVDSDTETIVDCRWKTYGCASAIASTSVLSEMVKGKTLNEAFNISPREIMEELGSLPDHKVHCSVLGDKALRNAINDYYKRTNQNDKIKEDKAKIICQCMNVTDHEIEDAILEGVKTYIELQERTKLGTVCGQCKAQATTLLNKYIEKHFNKPE